MPSRACTALSSCPSFTAAQMNSAPTIATGTRTSTRAIANAMCITGLRAVLLVLGRTSQDFERSSAVALFELLPATAPARIVAADLVAFGGDDRLRRGRGGRAPAADRSRSRDRRADGRRACDRLRARGRLVCVLEIAVLRLL